MFARKLLLVALAATVMACEKFSSDKPDSSGIYLDGKCVIAIDRVSVVNDNIHPSIGSIYRYRMFEKDPGDKLGLLVDIIGFYAPGETWSSPGHDFERLVICDVAGFGAPLHIPLEHGEYRGGCENVSSVTITNFDLGTYNEFPGTINKDGKIDIAVALSDGRTLRIHYRGKIRVQLETYYTSLLASPRGRSQWTDAPCPAARPSTTSRNCARNASSLLRDLRPAA